LPQRAAYLFLFLTVVIAVGAVFAPPNIGVWLSGAAIIIGTIVLLLFLASIFFKGRGNKSLGDILLVSASGVLPLPVHFAVLYTWFGIYRSGSTEKLTDFGSAFYFSVVTWTTLGYGDIVPGEDARLIVIAEVTAGYVVMALLIAALAEALRRA